MPSTICFYPLSEREGGRILSPPVPAYPSLASPRSLVFSSFARLPLCSPSVPTGHAGRAGRPSGMVRNKRHAGPLDRGLRGLPSGLRVKGDHAAAFPEADSHKSPSASSELPEGTSTLGLPSSAVRKSAGHMSHFKFSSGHIVLKDRETVKLVLKAYLIQPIIF